MEMRTFLNDDGEGVVDVGLGRPGDTAKPPWYLNVRVRGESCYEFGSPCGTCGILFNKLRSVDGRLTDDDTVKLLGELGRVPTEDVLRRLARVLPRVELHAFVAEARARLVAPGSDDDYFANEVVRLFGLEPPEYTKPRGPTTPYWRLGSPVSMPRRGYDGHEYAALLTAVAMPLHDVARLDRSRVEHWKTRASSGWTPTAVALSVLDGQMPATSGWRGPPAEDEQFLLTHVVLDGHHRLQAAAELGVPARILSFWSEEFSLVKTADALPVIERLCAPAKA